MEFSLAFYVLSQDSNGFSMILLGLTSCCWFLMVLIGLNKVFVGVSEFYGVLFGFLCSFTRLKRE